MLETNRITRTFSELRSAGKKTLLPFLTAGFPDLDTTAALLKDFEARNVRLCELGFPFSDPVADGPVIQSSYSAALDAGVTSEAIFRTVRGYRQDGGDLALAAMVNYSIVFKHGVTAFLAAAAEAGFDGIIVPDLPLEEAGAFGPLAADHGLLNIMLIAPTSPPDRRLDIAAHSRGFIYYISVAGITGQRDSLPERTITAVAELKTHTQTPICVGFGISKPEMVDTVCRQADGAIVGSAIVHRIAAAKDAPQAQLVTQIGDFVTELLAPLQ